MIVSIQPCAGLANRFRALVSAICAAKDLARPLEIEWLEEPGTCAVRFEELFDVASLPAGVAMARAAPSPVPRPTHEMCLSPGDWEQQKIRHAAGPIRIRSYGQFHQSDPARWLDTFRALRPLPHLDARVTALFTLAKGAPVVGVHIRRTDNRKAIEKSPTEIFYPKLDSYPPGTMFFIASDDERERVGLVSRYPGRVLLAARRLDRFSSHGGVDAFVDFLCLARCREIVGSAGSSFSEMAAAYGDKPLTVLTL
jgi:hypothetical protein